MQNNFGFYAFCLTLVGVGVAFLIMGLVARGIKKETPDIPLPIQKPMLK